jgi:hypothetical protein
LPVHYNIYEQGIKRKREFDDPKKDLPDLPDLDKSFLDQKRQIFRAALDPHLVAFTYTASELMFHDDNMRAKISD